MKGYIHSIETLGAVDGPGVRFVVFFQGCPMRCLYCHNPDTWEMNLGTLTETDELIEKITRNISFYRTGGITATGGEPLMQIDFLTELFTKAKHNNIHTCLDTSGITFNSNDTQKFDRLMEVCDLVMLDIKHIDENEHILLTKQSGKNVLEFAKYLHSKNKKMWIRHVIVPGITLNDEYLKKLGEFLNPLRDSIEKIETLPYHSLGKHKYENLNMEYPLKDTPDATKEEAQRAKEIISKYMETFKRTGGI